jgi:hypothetical protein
MSASINTFMAGMTGTAEALGDLTATSAVTQTLAVPGLAIGVAAAVAVAQNTTPAAPYASATTDGFASDGYITSSHTGHMSIDFPFGPTPVSADVSMTFTSTHGGGNLLSDYSLSWLASPSVHGLL